MTREVVLDTETTGRSVAQGHRIVSCGVVEILHGRITGRECEWFVNPGRESEEEARRVHGISDAWLAKQPDFESIRHEVEDFIGDDKIIAHNAPFDRGFLNNEFGLALHMASLTESEANRFPRWQWIDSLTLARKRFPQQRNDLDSLADRFGVERSHRIKHGALKDAKILARIWIELQRGGQGQLFGDELTDQTKRDVRVEPYVPKERGPRPPFKSRLTPEIIAHHAEYWSDKLGKAPVWNDYQLAKEGE